MPTAERNAIEQKNDGFIMMPRYVKAMCSTPYEVDLWMTIKDISGDTGECFLSTNDLAVLADMSLGTVSKARQSLIEKGLIIGSFHKDPGYQQPVFHLSIPDDIWQKNADFNRKYKKLKEKIELKQKQLSPHESLELSPHERGVTPHERGVTPHETKKILKGDLKVGGKEIGADAPAPVFSESNTSNTLENQGLPLSKEEVELRPEKMPAAPKPAATKKAKAEGKAAASAKDFPAVQMYHRIIGRYPVKLSWQTVTDAVNAVSERLGRQATVDDLNPFAVAWGNKYGNSVFINLAWLTEWAVKGEIPTYAAPVKQKYPSSDSGIQARSVR